MVLYRVDLSLGNMSRFNSTLSDSEVLGKILADQLQPFLLLASFCP